MWNEVFIVVVVTVCHSYDNHIASEITVANQQNTYSMWSWYTGYHNVNNPLVTTIVITTMIMIAIRSTAASFVLVHHDFWWSLRFCSWHICAFAQEWRCLRFLQSGGLIQSVTKVSLDADDLVFQRAMETGSSWLRYGYKTTILWEWGEIHYWHTWEHVGTAYPGDQQCLWTLDVSWKCGMPPFMAMFFLWAIDFRYYHYQSPLCLANLRKIHTSGKSDLFNIMFFSPLMPPRRKAARAATEFYQKDDVARE